MVEPHKAVRQGFIPKESPTRYRWNFSLDEYLMYNLKKKENPLKADEGIGAC